MLLKIVIDQTLMDVENVFLQQGQKKVSLVSELTMVILSFLFPFSLFSE